MVFIDLKRFLIIEFKYIDVGIMLEEYFKNESEKVFMDLEEDMRSRWVLFRIRGGELVI